MGRWRGENRGSGMTVTITATMDSLLLRLFFCYVFTLNPSQIKKKLDYICLVAWFMFQMVMFLRRLNSYIFTQNNNYKGIGIVFSPRTLGGNVTKRNVYRTSYKSSLLVFTTVKSMVFFILLLRNILHLSLHAKKRGVIPLQC